MPSTSLFTAAESYQPAALTESGAITLPTHFGDPASEYRSAAESAALFDFSDRGLITATGSDRKDWLHNLVTNAVKTLDDMLGNYAFSVDVKGRIQFDLNILSLPDVLWLDIDRSRIPAAMQHLDMRLITEEVQLSDVSEKWGRLGVTGPNTANLAEKFGIRQFIAMPELGIAQLSGGGCFLRHDFAGQPGFELIVPNETAAECWQRISDAGATPAGLQARDTLEIEAGRPHWGRDLDDHILPPETGQIERGISYNKGCYLGQEVIERMRSRGVLARRLVHITSESAIDAELPTEIVDDEGRSQGRLLSQIQHPVDGNFLGLAHLKTSLAAEARLKSADMELTVIGPIGDKMV